jgi:hypothetical protein
MYQVGATLYTGPLTTNGVLTCNNALNAVNNVTVGGTATIGEAVLIQSGGLVTYGLSTFETGLTVDGGNLDIADDISMGGNIYTNKVAMTKLNFGAQDNITISGYPSYYTYNSSGHTFVNVTNISGSPQQVMCTSNATTGDILILVNVGGTNFYFSVIGTGCGPTLPTILANTYCAYMFICINGSSNLWAQIRDPQGTIPPL